MKRYKYIRIFLMGCLVAFSMSIFAQGKEYHVAKNGNDRNKGSLNEPLKSISAAAAIAMPGDIITVHAGIYREQITPPRGGNSATERIVYQAAPGEQVIIKGSEVIKGWKKINNDTWAVTLPNTFFGAFNPYSDFIKGDWFEPTPVGRTYLTGEVYLNNNWLMQAAKKEEVMQGAKAEDPLWWAAADSQSTTIWAQFKGVDPNQELVEINVRKAIFYPDRPFINYLTVRGFEMEHAATNWAPPTAEQVGLIGTHWSKGWIIENNIVRYSKCVGIALGKYGDHWDNSSAESATGYVGTIERALSFGWNKGTIGDHLVQNNTISHCEQNGIVGSLGAAFSTIRGNTIHDIHMKRLFSGAEMAGIKLHGAVDVEISKNHIYRSQMGIWLDWMAQGTQVMSNLMYENDLDVFLEVNHGPTLVANNLFLSKINMLMKTKGVAFVHNIFGGSFNVMGYDGRLTPYLKPHSTFIEGLKDNEGGDIQFVNNLYVAGANTAAYYHALLPVYMTGDVYTKGTNQGEALNYFGWKDLSGKLKDRAIPKEVHDELHLSDFATKANLIKEGESIYLEINLDKNWLMLQPRKLVSTQSLKPVIVPNLPYENPDGSPLQIDTDYLGHQRNIANPSPGAFEITKSGKQRIKVW